MSQEQIDRAIAKDYAAGFTTDIESDTLPPGLTEDTIRFISAKKNEPEWLLEWRLGAFQVWREMVGPDWAHVDYPEVDFQSISYYSQPKSMEDRPKSLDEVDPELLATYEKLGIPLHEQEALAGVAVDVVFDSVSVATTFREKLAEAGVLFCSISEAVQQYPDLVRKHLGSVVPRKDNFYAALNSAVFSDGSFVYIPKGVRCPMELSTYFRINEANTGQFERTLIIADEGSHVSYLEGVPRPCVMKINCMRRWLNWLRWMMLRSNTQPCKTGIREMLRARVVSTTLSPNEAWRIPMPRYPGLR